MIAMLRATYPLHAFRQVTQAFMSPDIPKRPESVRELASIGYADDAGGNVVFMFDVPEVDVGAFLLSQMQRIAFISARAQGFNASVHVGQKVQEAIPALMPMFP